MEYLFKSKHPYKANLHCHTTVSDGIWSPEKTKQMYTSHGYSIVAFSDHDRLVDHSDLIDDTFLALNALELELRETGGRCTWTNRVYHFNFYACSPAMLTPPPRMDMDYCDIEAINAYIAERVREGFLVCYNHPYWSLQTYEDYAPLRGCFAMEIYNHSAQVSDGYYGYHPQVYDEMLRCGNQLYCVCTDDNHSDNDTFGGYVMVNSDSLDYADVIRALREGNFYSSQGPELYEISLDGRHLHIECSDASLIVVYTNGRNCYMSKGTALRSADFELTGEDEYIRVMCRDNSDRGVYSNAYRL